MPSLRELAKARRRRMDAAIDGTPKPKPKPKPTKQVAKPTAPKTGPRKVAAKKTPKLIWR